MSIRRSATRLVSSGVLVALLASCGAAVTSAPDAAAPASASAKAAPSGSASPRVSSSPRAATSPSASAKPGQRQSAEVIRVSDGDTIRVRINGSEFAVRYIGVDTPETVDPRKPVQCFGREASAFNKELVSGKTVELERDVSDTDKYGRLLRYVWLDGQMVNEALVRRGFARSSSYPPDVKYQDRFRAAEATARQQAIGLWSAACTAPVGTSASPARTASSAPASLAPSASPATNAPATASASPGSAALGITPTASRYGFVSISTLPGASCTAQARLPSGSLSGAAGLVGAHTVDTAGVVSWSYTTSANAVAGTGSHLITCAHQGQTANATIPFAVP